METYGHYINGTWIHDENNFTVYDKYTGEAIATVGNASKETVNKAVESALETFRSRKLSPTQRYDILMKAAGIIQDRKEELALVMVREVGKVLKDALAEIDRGTQTLIASAEEAKRIAGTGIPLGQPGNDQKKWLSAFGFR